MSPGFKWKSSVALTLNKRVSLSLEALKSGIDFSLAMKVFDGVFFQHKTVSSIGLAKRFIWSIPWDFGQPNVLKIRGLLQPCSLIILPRSSGWPTAPTSALAASPRTWCWRDGFLLQTSWTSLCQLQTFSRSFLTCLRLHRTEELGPCLD